MDNGTMLATIGDVSSLARKVWPDAISIKVALAPTNSCAQKMYRVTALGENQTIISQLDGPSLNKLQLLLKRQLSAETSNE